MEGSCVFSVKKKRALRPVLIIKLQLGPGSDTTGNERHLLFKYHIINLHATSFGHQLNAVDNHARRSAIFVGTNQCDVKRSDLVGKHRSTSFYKLSRNGSLVTSSRNIGQPSSVHRTTLIDSLFHGLLDAATGVVCTITLGQVNLTLSILLSFYTH